MSQKAKDVAERVFWTFIAAFAGVLVTTESADWDLSVLKVAALSGAAALATLLKAIAATKVGDPNRGSFSD